MNILISTLVDSPDLNSTTPILHIFSISSSRERVLLCLGLARGFALQNYSCLLIDFSFEFPLLSIMLDIHNLVSKKETVSDFYRDPTKDIDEEKFEDYLLKVFVTRGKKGFFNVFPASTSIAVAKEIDFLDDKLLKKSTNKLRRFFRKIQEKQLFDIIIINGQDSLNQETQNAMEIATHNFCLVHHSKYELEMVRKVISHFNNLHPYYHIHGLLLNNYMSYATQSKNQEYIAKLETEFRVPVIATIDLLMNHLNSFPLQRAEWDADEYYLDLCTKVLDGLLNPRIIILEQPLILYSILITNTAGLPIYSYFFKEGKYNDILMSGPLSAIISGISALVSQLLTRKQKMNMIDLSKAKLFVVEDKKFRGILLASKYEEGLLQKLERFTIEFLDKYKDELQGDLVRKIDEAEIELIERHFGET